MPLSAATDPVRSAFAACRRYFIAAGAFSAASNLLYLAPSLFMLQVYDRVVPTGGIVTLAALAVLTLAALVALGGFEWLRARLLVKASARLESELALPSLKLALTRIELSRGERAEVMRSFDTLRQGLTSPGLVAILDAPWTPIYVVAAFLLHPAFGIATILAAASLMLLAWLGDRATARPMRHAAEAASIALPRQSQAAAHADEIRALGIGSALALLQAEDRRGAGVLQMRANFAANTCAGLIKVLRLTLQSGVLALGAVLVVDHAISAGAMIAASLLMARALAPIEQFVGAWRSIAMTRIAYGRLRALFAGSAELALTTLPPPAGALQVERLTVLAPNTDRVVLADASFAVTPGEIIGVVGAAGAGKSTLLRAIAGAALPARGQVRFDGASRADWDAERLAATIGYLPQEAVLFAGSVKDNIARFRHVLDADGAAIDAAAVAAARAADVHDLILRLPNGYDTPVGPGGIGLSVGQVRRIAMARALFDNPAILLLDEPTANLDAEGQQAFVRLLAECRSRGTTVLFASHSVDALAAADKLLVLAGGRVQHFAANAALRPSEDRAAPAPISFQKVSIR